MLPSGYFNACRPLLAVQGSFELNPFAPIQNNCRLLSLLLMYSKTCVKWLLSKRQKIVFQDQLSLNAGQMYGRMVQGEHSAIRSTFIKLPFVIKIFALSIFEWSLYTGFTVLSWPILQTIWTQIRNRLIRVSRVASVIKFVWSVSK